MGEEGLGLGVGVGEEEGGGPGQLVEWGQVGSPTVLAGHFPPPLHKQGYCRSKVGTLPKIPTWVLRTLIHSSDQIPINQRSCRVCIACRSLSKGQSTQSGTLVQDPAFVGSCLALHSREVMSNLRCH